MENTYGAVSIGSLYTFGLGGVFEMKNGKFLPKEMPPKWPETREEACRLLAEWHLYKPQFQHFYDPRYKSLMMIAIANQWKAKGVLIHYNRGYEGSSLGIPRNRLDLIKTGFPVLGFEGSMGDERDLDEVKTLERFDTFMELLGVKKLKS
jgi:benzoyl-CoA reductase subunit B